MAIRRILITGDIFRPTGSFDSSQKLNIRWLAGLVQAQIGIASGLEISSLLVEDVSSSLTALYSAANLSPSLDTWAQIYERLPDAMADRLRPHFAGALVVGFELPPGLRRLLDEIGTPYIDIVLHPVRYMQDLLLGFASNSDEIQTVLDGFSMSEGQARLETAPIRAFAGRSQHPELSHGTLLFIGQMSEDRSMISNGRFLRPKEYMRSLIQKLEIMSETRTIAVKLHPMERNQTVLRELRRLGFEVLETSVSTYTLLASDRISSVFSVSSSVCEEARLFDKSADYGLGPSTPVRYRETLRTGIGHVSIYNHYMSTDFWRKCLASHLEVTEFDGFPPVSAPNLLRSTLRCYWGYEDFAFEGGQRLGAKWAGTGSTRGTLATIGMLEQPVAQLGQALRKQLRKSETLRSVWHRLKR
ncbi:hypothetical protein [Pseudoroseicyclus sp. CXY001]|uniref:hypothetical protein n=1 Tax=Pseudoroseicyclus sp. CXY001 TaxID=3242492 RepID=UPI0035710489